MTDKNVYPTIFIKRMGKKGKPARGGQARRAGREYFVWIPPSTRGNDKEGAGMTRRADKPARGGQARQRRTSPPEADKSAPTDIK